jgi:hypothetical protein
MVLAFVIILLAELFNSADDENLQGLQGLQGLQESTGATETLQYLQGAARALRTRRAVCSTAEPSPFSCACIAAAAAAAATLCCCCCCASPVQHLRLGASQCSGTGFHQGQQQWQLHDWHYMLLLLLVVVLMLRGLLLLPVLL